jgi:two-component system, NarL family, response regulator NreC
MTSLTIVLADDHQVVRSGLRTLLEADLGAQIVGEAADGLEAVQLVERQQPDILIVDLMMPGLSGLEVARRVRQRARQIGIIVLSMHAAESYVREALRAGATGYVLKESPAAEVVQAVRAAADGRRFLSPALSERLIDAYIQQSSTTTEDPYDLLTDREREVLYLAALGQTGPEIAERLVLSVRTVENYRAGVLRKLDLHNQTDLVRYAIKRGIIALDG